MPNGGRRRHLTIAYVAVVAGALLLPVVSALSPFEHRIDPVPRADSGSHAFTARQRDGRGPVGYDPCRPIRVAVNPVGAPPGWRELIDTAIAHVSGPSGLRFDVIGLTDDRPGEIWDPVDGYGPVLVSWASRSETVGLEGDTVGRGFSTSILDRGRSYYVTGEVTLDPDQFLRLTERPDAGTVLQPILDHEFGHLVGLAHVDDEGELMNADNLGRTTWGPGDLAGLALLGRLPCR